MKKLLIIITVLSIAALSACKKDKLITVSQNISAPVLKSPAADTSIAVTASDTANIINITWSTANYGVSGINTYYVQVDSAGNGFKKFVTIGTVSSKTTFSISLNSLNSQLLAGLGLASNAATSVE